jgi:imidazolonepropionase-like amidohydrolase
MPLARLPALLADPAPAAGRLLLTNARLFDGTGSAPRPPAAVMVQDGVIAGVGPAPGAAPEGALRIDAANKTVMPGIVNCHVHAIGHLPAVKLGADPPSDAVQPLLLARQLQETLRMGVTTVRDMGTLGDQVLVARQAMRYGAFRGPRLLTCGRIISATAPGGVLFAGMYREVDGVDEVRKGVREQIRRGADLIKVMATGARSVELEAGLVTDPCAGAAGMPAQLTLDELRAAAEEAARMGYPVAAHAEGLAGCEAAIDLRMRTIEHGMYLHQRPDLLARMAELDIALVPTFSSSYWMAGRDDQVGLDGDGLRTWTDELDRNAHVNIAQSELTLRAAHAAGTPIALGGDTMQNKGGAWIEILRMIHHGLPARAALAASTSAAARAIGLGHLVGTVAPGMTADLLVIDGDPVAHPELLGDPARIWLVLQAGRPVAGTALEVSPHDLAAR